VLVKARFWQHCVGGTWGVAEVPGQWPQHELRVDADGCTNLIVVIFTLHCAQKLLDRKRRTDRCS